MLIIRRTLFILPWFIMAVALVLLLNITATNPTHRRYSSTMPVLTGGGTSQEIGLSAERILAVDLGLPRNDDPDQRQCICNSPYNRPPGVSECRVCYAYAQQVSTFRRPDFVGNGFIAESKNRQNLPYSQSDQVEQIGDYVVAARAMNMPLWLYIRVNTQIDPEFYRLVESTGGGVVAYFTVPGYIDPVDQAAKTAFLVACGMLVIGILWEGGARVMTTWTTRPQTPHVLRPEKRPVSVRKTDNASEFMAQMERKSRETIDKENARDDQCP